MPVRRQTIRPVTRTLSIEDLKVDGLLQTVVRTDLNWIRDGLLQAFVDDADRPVNAGEVVFVLDEDRTIRQATVKSIDDDIIRLQILPLELSTEVAQQKQPANTRTWTFSIPEIPWAGSLAPVLGVLCNW